MAWSTLDESTQSHWEAIMTDHQNAHPAVMLTMVDGKAVPMTVPVDDIILKAEEAGLIIASPVEESAEITP